jgi:hypothetical protein
MQFRTWLETFDAVNNYIWKASDKNGKTAQFVINKKTYIVEFNATGMGEYIVDFYLKLNKNQYDSGITNTGDAFAIFSTVLAIINEFVKKTRPFTGLEFTASEPSRQKLYQHLIKRFASQGWDVEEPMPNTYMLRPDWVKAHLQRAY